MHVIPADDFDIELVSFSEPRVEIGKVCSAHTVGVLYKLNGIIDKLGLCTPECFSYGVDPFNDTKLCKETPSDVKGADIKGYSMSFVIYNDKTGPSNAEQTAFIRAVDGIEELIKNNMYTKDVKEAIDNWNLNLNSLKMLHRKNSRGEVIKNRSPVLYVKLKCKPHDNCAPTVYSTFKNLSGEDKLFSDYERKTLYAIGIISFQVYLCNNSNTNIRRKLEYCVVTKVLQRDIDVKIPDCVDTQSVLKSGKLEI